MKGFGRIYSRGMLAFVVYLFFAVSYFAVSDLTRSDVIAAEATASDSQTVKAGIFSFDGYHMKDADGHLSGYGIEFLDLVSEYSHLNFEYTGYDKSWNDMLDMLKSGAIDVVTSARKTKEREADFAFSIPIGRNCTVLSAKTGNDQLQSGDYRTYEGMTAGVIRGSSQNAAFAKFAEEKGFSYRIREYEDSGQLTDALQDGSIDAALSSDLRKMENEKLLETITLEHFYAIVRKDDKQLLDEINYAVEQMNIHEGDWNNVLYYKYYGPVYASADSFTKREEAYIQDVLAGRKKITAMAMVDRMPYSFEENGVLKGVIPDYFKEVMQKVSLPYELIVPKDRTEYYELADTNGVDVVIDKRTSDASMRNGQYGGFYTDSFLTTGMAKVTRKDFRGEIRSVAAAKEQGSEPLEHGLTDNVKVLDYETREQALKAVQNHKADAAYVYTYAAQQFVSQDTTNSLHYSIVNGAQFDFQMYVRNSCDHELVTILNKCIQQMPQDIQSQLIAKYTSYAPKDVTFVQFIRAHPGFLVILVLAVALAAGVIGILFLRAGWNRKVLAAVSQSKKELEAQLAIVNALSRDYVNVFAVNVREASSRVIKSNGYVACALNLDAEDRFSYVKVLQSYVKDRVHPQDQQYLAKALSLEKVTEQLEKADEYTGSFRILDHGETHNFQFTYVNVDGIGQTNKGIILAGFRNIDEMVRREKEQKEILAEALAEANHANHAKTMFLNNMSHDIRTPMNAIIGFTSLAATHIEHTDLVRSYLGKIMTASRHLLSLINDVLDMSRIESGKVRIEEKEAGLPEMIHDLKTIVQSEIKAKQLEFHIDTVDVTNEQIICDKLRLNQVLLNTISNAMKYTKPGGMVSVRIIQTSDAPDGYASYQFRIKDNGIGMSKEFLKHVFEPFEREQTSTVSGIQGTGLGLAITKNIVDMMNGTITVESEEGKGTEFVICFQFRTADHPVKTGRVEHLEDLRALIADDDVNTCMSVSKMLSSIGMHPDWTTQGKEAVVRTKFALEQNDPYTVYIIDWLMPDLNGIEIVRQIRRIIGDLPIIIVLTAYDWADVEEEAKEAGVTAFCAKPVFLTELRELLTASAAEGKDSRKQETDEAGKLFCGKKILLVEDNEINQEIAKAILEEAGFAIDLADDGSVAVEMMEQAPGHTYDLILMDIQMTRMNGYDATRAIRAMDDPVKAQIPIVAMTANAFEEDRQLALEAGMNDHVAKPIDVDRLMETLRNILSLDA